MGEWTPCVFVLSPFSIEYNNPLHVLSFKNSSNHENNFHSSIIAIKRANEILSSTSLHLFVNVRWVKETNSYEKEFLNEIKKASKYGTVLCASQIFLCHYSIELNKTYTMKEVKPYPLERVTLGTSCNKTFVRCKEDPWNTELTVTACQENILCRQGDMFFWRKMPGISDDNSRNEKSVEWNKFSVLECKNILQGIITIKTEIVIVLISQEEQMKYDIDESRSSNTKYQENHLLSKHWTLMRYTSGLLLPYSINQKKLNPVLLIMASAFNLVNSKCIALNVKVLPVSPFPVEHLDELDPLNTVILSPIISKKLNVMDKSWMKIALKKETSEFSMQIDSKNDSDSYRCVQVIFKQFDTSDDYLPQAHAYTAYVSPLLWFNLNDHPSTLSQPDAKVTLQKLENGKNINEFIQPKFAKETNLALIQAPHYDTAEYFDELLRTYFSTVRYVEVDDVICVGSTNEPDFLMTSLEQRRMDSTMVYFKVTQIKGPHTHLPGYLMDNKHTSFYQAGTAFSFIPCTIDVHLLYKPLHPIWYSPNPLGMEKYMDELENLINPYMKSFVREQVLPCFLLVGSHGCGKQPVLKATCRRINIHYYSIECHDLVAETSSATEAKLKQALITGSQFAPCMIHLKNINILCRMRDTSREDFRVLSVLQETISSLLAGTSNFPLLIVGTTTDLNLLPVDVTTFFFHHVIMEQPNEEERMRILSGLLANAHFTTDVSLPTLANKTQGLVLGDLCALISSAVHLAFRRIIESCCEGLDLKYEDEEDIYLAGICLQNSDFTTALEQMNISYSSAIGAPKVPSVRWEDIGGLQEVKDSILDTVQLPLRHPELMSTGLRRSGILLFGPPGTGKTLLAKAVATECSLHFLSVKGPELLNMYVGQSEENIREVFRRARNVAPCIIFFDELDSLAPNRGRSGDSGGVMDRVVSQLLAELDGLSKTNDVFVIGATNRPDLIDPALLRPGRFDKLLYVGIGKDKESQLKILKALTRKFNLAPDVSLDTIISQCPSNLTGSDFYALCSGALLQAVSRCVEYVNINTIDKKASLLVSMEDFQNSLEKLVPSVSLAELERYEALRESLGN